MRKEFPATSLAARYLRRRQTHTEGILWQALRGRRVGGLKFRRQHPLGSFILDFYCHEARLAVEIDGGVHLEREQAARDAVRDDLLRSLGIRVLRVSTTDVVERLDVTLARILAICTELPRPRP